MGNIQIFHRQKSFLEENQEKLLKLNIFTNVVNVGILIGQVACLNVKKCKCSLRQSIKFFECLSNEIAQVYEFLRINLNLLFVRQLDLPIFSFIL